MSWISPALIEQLGLCLLHFLWQGALIGLLYAFTLPATRAASARTRYGIAVLALASLAAAPPLTLLLLQTTASGASSGMATDSMAMMSLRIAGDGTGGGVSVMHWVVAAWLAGVFVLSMRLLVSWHFLRRLRRTADFSAATSLRPRFMALANRLGISRIVAVAVSSRIRSPVVIGWLKPLVLLPPAIVAGLPSRQLEMVLAHELAHVRRLDHLVNLAQTAIETVLFYHPVVRWVSRRIRIERENACDDLAVAVTNDRLAYVEMLASLEKLRFQGPQLALAVHDGQMLGRIRRLVERGRPERQHGLTLPALICALVLAGTTGVGLLPDDRGEERSALSSAPDAQPSDPAESLQTVEPSEPARAVGDAPPEVTGSTAEPAVEAPDPEPEPLPTAAVPADAPTMGDDDAAAEVGPSSTEGQAAAAFGEQPAGPTLSIESGRLPPVDELTQRPRIEQVAMLERPGLSVPRLPAPEPARTAPLRSPELEGGELLERVAPEYPERAERRGIDGTVEVEFVVMPDGSVRDIAVLDERPRGLEFGPAARRAIAQWQFEPFRRNGEAVERRIDMAVEFVLGQSRERECRKVIGSRIPRCY